MIKFLKETFVYFALNSANPKYFEVLLKLAHEAKKIAKPNPAVAAIIVRDQKIIGQGHTREWG